MDVLRQLNVFHKESTVIRDDYGFPSHNYLLTTPGQVSQLVKGG